MHKKPLVAVFVVGLLLLSVAAWGAPAPGDDYARVKGTRPTNLQMYPLETSTAVSIQAGQPLALPGMFCVGTWMGARYWRIGGTFAGGELYSTLQDPSGTLPYSWSVAGCSPTNYGSFNVTAVTMEVSKRPTSEQPNPFTFDLQPIVFDADVTDPNCPLMAGVKCAGPVYAVTLTAGGTTGVTFAVNLPFVIECCVSGPYFGAFYLAGTWAAGIAQVTTDDADTPPAPPAQVCHQYYFDGTSLVDWGPWYHLRQYSEGYTPDEAATQCTPGICDYQWWYDGARQNDDWTNGYGLPTATRKKMGVRFMSDCQDTLKSVSFGLYGPFTTGSPDILVEVWAGDDLAGSSCGVSPLPGTLLEQVLVPYASLVFYPLVNDVALSNHVWGVLNGGLSEAIFVTISEPSDGVNGATALQAGPPVTAGCPADPHSIAFYAPTSALPGWHYLGEFPPSLTQREFWMDAYICKEQCPIVEANCAAAGPDDWNTVGHDYKRTSASAMNLGDPCMVREQWSVFLPRLSNFTNPVIAGDKVYVSSDNEVNVYDLATSALLGQVGAFPYTSGQVRCNVSVEGERVFLTGGTALAISCWDPLLTTNFWSNDLTAGVLGYGSNGPLNTLNRFGATAVYAIVPGLVDPLGDSIVAVGTQATSSSGNGYLYALDVKTGFLYTGWATNPQILDHGSMYSPTYDGENLYVGTAYLGVGTGSLYSFNAATGTPNWNYKDALVPDDGWPAGVSVEGNIIYGASYYSDIASGLYGGRRYAIDKTLAGPGPNLAPAAILWRHNQGPDLYGAPTIGPNFLYIPQDAPSGGVLMIDKALGKAVYNWAADGVGGVSQNVTLTCDKYLFAGDRFGYWYLLNATDQSMVWRREFMGIVNGTALAHHSVTGDDYALVNARSSLTDPAGAGVLTWWRFNQPVRPFMRQNVYETDVILVPLNSGDNLGPQVETGVYSNDGCVALNITNTNYYPVARSFTKVQQKYAAAYVDRKIGSDWVTYFEGGQVSKKAQLAGARWVNEELTALDQEMEEAHKLFAAKGTRGATAAGATDVMGRTHAVTYSANPIPPAGSTNMSWLYDGTDLGRGIADEYIESVNDDPDFYPEDMTYLNIGYPYLTVHYVGGCPPASTPLYWNTLGAMNTETVFNAGALGNAAAGALIWGADGFADFNNFDGGFMLMGDSSTALGGAMVRIDFYGFTRLYVPDPRLSDATCGFDAGTDVLMGYRRDASCGDPVDILGSWVQAVYSDTDFFYAPTSPLATMGLSVIQTEIGANDPLYGDFKLLWWHITNRDATTKTGMKAATYFDWDIDNDAQQNVGLMSDNFNGYAIWDAATPHYAYGMFNPNLKSAYCGVDPLPGNVFKILVNLNDTTYGHSPGVWGSGTASTHAADLAYGWALCSKPPFRQYMGKSLAGEEGPPSIRDDRGAFLVNQPFDLGPNAETDQFQALYAVPAASNTVAGIEALAVEVAKKAARWSGFARGDVNDDGCVNLLDACIVYHHAADPSVQLYPDTYCGDVNIDDVVTAADGLQLLLYVSGDPLKAPLGKWRFAY